MTRAQLLGLCKQRGLKATAWKRGRMAEELLKLEGAAPEQEPPGQAEAPQPEAGDDEGQSERETTPAENPDPSPRRSGWCTTAPMWSHQHWACRAAGCACPCHEPGWEQPAPPEGARLSKFNPDNRQPVL